MKLKNFLLLMCLFAGSRIQAQYQFHRLIGGPDHERCQTAFSTPDNCYFINAATLSYGQGDVDVMLMKLDSLGQTIWDFSYGTPTYDNAEFAILTSDSSFVCVGRSNLLAGSPESAIMFRIDQAGGMIWSQAFSGNGNNNLVRVLQTSDLGFAATGYTANSMNGDADILLVRTDSNGDTIFSRSYGTIETEAGTGIIQLPDAGFLICGRQITFPGGIARADGILLRTDAAGNLLWTKQYGDVQWEELTAIRQAADGGFFVVGSTTGYGAGDYDVLLMKTDSSGAVVWSKTYGGLHSDAGYDLHITSDSSLIISGYTESLGYGHLRVAGDDSTNIFLMKTDQTGGLIWMEVYGDGLQDEGFLCAIANDGGYLVTGFTTNYLLSDSSQMLVIKTDANGESGCHELSVLPVDSVFSMPFIDVNYSEYSGLTITALNLVRSSITTANDNACLYAFSNSDHTSNDAIQVFPNPFNEFIDIFIAGSEQETVITLTDMLGRDVVSMPVVNESMRIYLPAVKPGVYLLTQQSPAGDVLISKKVVKYD